MKGVKIIITLFKDYIIQNCMVSIEIKIVIINYSACFSVFEALFF